MKRRILLQTLLALTAFQMPIISLANNTAICSRYNGTKNGGYSIRCIRD